jgi:hypothetical protein
MDKMNILKKNKMTGYIILCAFLFSINSFLAPETVQATTNLTFRLKFDNIWIDGKTGEVGSSLSSCLIENNSSCDINGWKIEFDADFDIYEYWCFTMQHVNSHYTLNNVSWNATIKKGSSIHVGFNAHKPITTTSVKNLKLNGTAMNLVLVVSPPTVSITANPGICNVGDTVKLSWTYQMVNSYSLYNGIGMPLGSSMYVQPTTTKTYTIKVIGPNATASASVAVTVRPLPIVHITADDGMINPGVSTTLRWTAQNTSKITIDDGTGPVLQSSSSPVVSPLHTTKYVICATGDGGVALDSVTVQVNTENPSYSNLTATDSLNSAGTLSVNGATTLDGGATITGGGNYSLNVQGNNSEDGSVHVTGCLNVTGSFTTGSAAVTGTATCNDVNVTDLTVSDSTHMNNVIVTGTATINNATVSGDLIVTGSSTLNGPANLNGGVVVKGGDLAFIGGKKIKFYDPAQGGPLCLSYAAPGNNITDSLAINGMPVIDKYGNWVGQKKPPKDISIIQRHMLTGTTPTEDCSYTLPYTVKDLGLNPQDIVSVDAFIDDVAGDIVRRRIAPHNNEFGDAFYYTLSLQATGTDDYKIILSSIGEYLQGKPFTVTLSVQVTVELDAD